VVNGQPGKLVRLHLNEQDRFESSPLYEAIVKKCQDLGVAGVTVLRGIEGYGSSSELHRAHMLGHDQPIIVTIVETAENVLRILPELERMLGTGVIAISDVEVIRIKNGAKSQLVP
jgi:PII-like signaling protein